MNARPAPARLRRTLRVRASAVATAALLAAGLGVGAVAPAGAASSSNHADAVTVVPGKVVARSFGWTSRQLRRRAAQVRFAEVSSTGERWSCRPIDAPDADSTEFAYKWSGESRVAGSVRPRAKRVVFRLTATDDRISSSSGPAARTCPEGSELDPLRPSMVVCGFPSLVARWRGREVRLPLSAPSRA